VERHTATSTRSAPARPPWPRSGPGVQPRRKDARIGSQRQHRATVGRRETPPQRAAPDSDRRGDDQRGVQPRRQAARHRWHGRRGAVVGRGGATSGGCAAAWSHRNRGSRRVQPRRQHARFREFRQDRAAVERRTPPLDGRAAARLLRAINVLAFSPDGTNLVGSTGITARLWDSVLWTGDQRTQHARACAAGRRNLSRSEWTRLLPGEPYHETCRGA
jgi:hypothetical protein